jgi:hypothetical protein
MFDLKIKKEAALVRPPLLPGVCFMSGASLRQSALRNKHAQGTRRLRETGDLHQFSPTTCVSGLGWYLA